VRDDPIGALEARRTGSSDGPRRRQRETAAWELNSEDFAVTVMLSLMRILKSTVAYRPSPHFSQD